MTFYIGDCETDGLLDEVTKFHCICFSPLDEDIFHVFCDYNQIKKDLKRNFEDRGIKFYPTEWYLKLLNSPKTTGICIHNIFGYDLPVFKKLNNVEYDWRSINGRELNIIDSLVLSRYLNPDRLPPKGVKGGHGLQAWGVRTGISKPSVEDWSNQPLDVYINRVVEDVKINKATYLALLNEMKDIAIPNGSKRGNWEIPLKMAHKTYYLMQEQERTGVCFDIEGAKKLIIRIDREMKEIEDEVEPILGMRELPQGQQPNFPSNCFKKAFDYKAPWTTTGKLKKQVKDYLNKIFITGEKRQESYIKNLIIKRTVEGVDIYDNYIEDIIPKHKSLLTSHALNYCKKFEIDNDYRAFQEIKKILSGRKKERKLIEQMKLANQDDIKKYFIENLGWEPTLWRYKNLLVDQKTKQNFPKTKQEEQIKKYIKDIQKSPYKSFILKEIGYKREPDFNSNSFYNKVKKKGRAVPSSPQLKDISGNLCPNLEKIDNGIAKKIILWLSLRNRRTTIKSFDKDTGWLNHKRLKIDGRLPGSSTGITNTTRQRHHIICNIPAPSDNVVLGKESRGLFIHPKGYCCVGADASGIESRAMAEASWNFDNGAYADVVLNGDVHIQNAEAFSKAIGREVGRSEGKSPYYAGIYGCQDKKMASLLGVDEGLGGNIINALWSVAPGLKQCKDALEKYWEATGKKYIIAINGMKIFTRSRHSLLNAYLQSMDAILMDWACCWIHDKIREEELDAIRWIYYHDEVNHYDNINNLGVEYFPIDNKPEEYRNGKQYSKPKIFREGRILHFGLKKAEDPKPTDQWIQHYSRVGEICVEGIKNAGKYFGMRVPLDGQYIVGNSWGTTH